ncbi:hypothetical protein F5Y13DRAFT_154558 [Hypoxylon sp. FL1857]|nr:hypothetical protein F5Y13DRAFT_154558 [Hypoxylon sp. FL1857]
MKAMLSLPPSLLVLLAAATQLRAQQQQHPTAIRKMSLDEGEKLFPEHFAFGPAPAQQLLHHGAREATGEDLLVSGNSSAAVPFLPPYPRHYDYHGSGLGKAVVIGGKEGNQAEASSDSGSLYRRAREVLAKLQGRQFACPSDTHSCTNIDQPNYCCSTGTTCFVVTNAPESGNVGCCPNGQNCGVTVGACSSGATACPANLGGGCCIAGFVCASVGCVASSVTVINPTTSQTTITTTAVPTASPSTQVITVIVTVTPSGGGAPVTSTTTQTTTATPAPAPSSTSSPNPTNTYTGGIPPYRPTSGSSVSSDTSSISYCPTGFYPCLASAGGGCCRTGRDCSTTSCPPPPASTTIISNGVTVVVPLTDALAASSALTTPTCASGWFLCGADAGPVAGCCPSGYACGTASCTLSTSTATATVQKELPNSASPGSGGAGLGLLAVLILVASLYLL